MRVCRIVKTLGLCSEESVHENIHFYMQLRVQQVNPRPQYLIPTLLQAPSVSKPGRKANILDSATSNNMISIQLTPLAVMLGHVRSNYM